jgi:peroxiredoxin
LNKKQKESNHESFGIMILTKKTLLKEITLMTIITLLDTLVNALMDAEENFLDNPSDFYSLEKSVKSSTEAFAADFLGKVLTSINEQICKSSWRDGKYNIQRTDTRTLISSVGDVTFDCTYFKSVSDGRYTYLLENMIGLSKNEKFTEEAEVVLLTEALKTSYKEATLVLPSKQQITKTTVMNKVHQIAEDVPYKEPEEKKQVEYLFIEADEDHIAEQHGDGTTAKENHSFISKLVYVYECKQDVAGSSTRKELMNRFYFGGLYQGNDGNKKLWKNVQEYIDKTYDTEKLKRIFVSGDGAAWIKSGADYLDKALFCADKFHLMKYINQAAAQMLDERDIAKDELWHVLYSKKPKARERFEEYTNRMLCYAKNPEKVENLRTYVLGNWAAIRRTLRNKLVNGCSAESHVSHVLSDRMSSRPMGWSQTGADRMSKLRCYECNYGREGIINLVRYSREQKILKATGTDNISVKEVPLREITAEHYDQARSYIDRLQVHVPGMTSRKTASIRTQLWLI